MPDLDRPAVVLIHTRGDSSVAYSAPYENVRLQTVAASLARVSVVTLLDMGLEPRTIADVYELCSDATLVVADALFRTMESSLVLLSQLRDLGSQARLVLMGDAARVAPARVLFDHAGVDAVVYGDGDRVVPRLLDPAAWETGTAGAVMRTTSGSIVSLPSGDGILEPLPWPVRPFTDAAVELRPVIDVESSRGCPFRCSFCMVGSAFAVRDAQPSHLWCPRDPADVFAEIRHLVERFGIRRFNFVDDNFLGGANRGARRAEEIAGLLEELDIQFSLYCRASAVDRGLFRKLRSAGLCQVHIGFESGSDSVLRRLRKDQSVADGSRALAVLRELAVRVVPSFILFEPRQDLSEFVQSISWIVESETSEGFSSGSVIPIPGTAVTEELAAEGLTEPAVDWTHAFVRPAFVDSRVHALADAVAGFETAIEASGLVPLAMLESAYHRFNDALLIADNGPLDPSVKAHATFREREARMVARTAVELSESDRLVDIVRLIDDWIAMWKGRYG